MTLISIPDKQAFINYAIKRWLRGLVEEIVLLIPNNVEKKIAVDYIICGDVAEEILFHNLKKCSNKRSVDPQK